MKRFQKKLQEPAYPHRLFQLPSFFNVSALCTPSNPESRRTRKSNLFSSSEEHFLIKLNSYDNQEVRLILPYGPFDLGSTTRVRTHVQTYIRKYIHTDIRCLYIHEMILPRDSSCNSQNFGLQARTGG